MSHGRRKGRHNGNQYKPSDRSLAKKISTGQPALKRLQEELQRQQEARSDDKPAER